MAWNAVQDASGVGVSPVRTESATPVPVGTTRVHESVPQFVV